MPVAKPRTTTTARPAPIAYRVPAPPSPIRQIYTARTPQDDAAAIVDAFLACANGLPPGTLVAQEEADGLRLIQRRGMIGLVSDAGVTTQASEQDEKALGALPIAHIKDGVIYRDYTNYVDTEIERRARLHVALFEQAFADRRALVR